MQCTKFQLKLPLVSDTNFASCCISLPFFYGSSCFCAQSAHVSKISYLNFLSALSRHWYLQFGPSLNYWPALRNFLHWDKLRFGTWIPLCTTLVFHIASAFKVRGDLLQINAEPSVVIDSNTFFFFCFLLLLALWVVCTWNFQCHFMYYCSIPYTLSHRAIQSFIIMVTTTVLKGTMASAHIALGVNPSATFTSKFRSDDLQNIMRIALVSRPACSTT